MKLLSAAALLASVLVAVPGPGVAADDVGESLLGADEYAPQTVVGADGTLVVVYLKDVMGWDQLYGRVYSGTGWSNPIALSTAGLEVHSEWDVAAGDGSGVVAFAEDDQDKAVVVQFTAGGVFDRDEVSAGSAYLGHMKIAVDGSNMAVAYNDRSGGNPRIRVAVWNPVADGFRAPRTIGSEDEKAEVRDLALSGDRVWVAYALKDGPNPIESFWGTYRYSVTPEMDVWHTDDLFFSQFGELRIDASTAGDVVFSTSTPAAGIFTRSFEASDIPVSVPPEWYPELGDAVDHGPGQVWDQSEHGHRVQLIRTPANEVRVLSPGGSPTAVMTGASGNHLLLDDDGGAMVIRSVDGQRIDVHRGGLGQPFAVTEQIGAGTSTKSLEDAGEGGGVEYVVYEDGDTDELLWWVNGGGSSTPTGPPVTLHSLPTWTLAPSVNVGWTSSAETAELQTQSGRSYQTSRSSWEVVEDPATSPTATFVAVGATHCFRARSHGEGLALGEFSGQRCTTRPMDDRSLAGASKWKKLSASKYFNGKASMTKTKGRTLSATVKQSREIAVVLSKCSTCGKVRVYWKGNAIKTIDLRGSGQNRRVITLKKFSSPQNGTVKIKVLTSGKKVIIDGLGSRRPAGS